jgi:hypothetical protein
MALMIHTARSSGSSKVTANLPAGVWIATGIAAGI